jgi:hypothetical protein
MIMHFADAMATAARAYPGGFGGPAPIRRDSVSATPQVNNVYNVDARGADETVIYDRVARAVEQANRQTIMNSITAILEKSFRTAP